MLPGIVYSGDIPRSSLSLKKQGNGVKMPCGSDRIVMSERYYGD